MTPEARPDWRAGFSWLSLSAREISLVCGTCFAVWTILLIVSLLGGQPGRSAVSHYIGNDFAEFYIAGKILNEHPSADLYDFDLQTRLFQGLHPEGNARLWFACAPHLALAFRPFAVFPYRAAYLLWIFTATALYLAGLWALFPYLSPLRKDQRQAAILLALCFWPFAGWALHGGQVGVIAFAICAGASRLDLGGNRFLAGALLAGLLYKPSLAPLLAALVLVRWNLRLIAGFAAGVLASVAGIWASLGAGVLRSYLGVLSMYRRFAASGESPWNNWGVLIDGNTFIRRILGSSGPWTGIVVVAALAPLLVWVAWEWRRYESSGEARRRLLWAAALTWVPVISAYGTVYDSLVVVVAAFLAASVVYAGPGADGARRMFALFLLLIQATSLLGPLAANRLRVHLYTVVLAAFGAWQLRRAARERLAGGRRATGKTVANQ